MPLGTTNSPHLKSLVAKCYGLNRYRMNGQPVIMQQ